MELEKIVICVFEKIILKYDLQTTLVSANEVKRNAVERELARRGYL